MARGRPDYSGTAVDVQLKAEWEERHGNRKHVTAVKSGAAPGEYATTTYTVPSGKTFYVTTITAAGWASDAADADLPQHIWIEVYAPDVATLHIRMGGDGGVGLALSQPIRVRGGENLILYCYNASNHNMELSITARGYEIEE